MIIKRLLENKIFFFQNLFKFGTSVGNVSYKTIFFYLTVISFTVISVDLLAYSIFNFLDDYINNVFNSSALRYERLKFDDFKTKFPEGFVPRTEIVFDEDQFPITKSEDLTELEREVLIRHLSTDPKNYTNIMTPIINKLIWEGVEFDGNVDEEYPN